MVLVNVIRRFINTIPMQKSITQYDQSAVTYRFQIDRRYETLDLGSLGWEWSIAWKNSLDVPSMILVDPVVEDEKVFLDWTPVWPETASGGLFEFQIRAKKDDTGTGGLLKWNTQTAHIDFNTSIGLGHVNRGILEDYLDKFMQLCSTATIEAEEQRAITAELALAESIQDTEERINVQLSILSDAIDSLAGRLDDFDLQVVSNYVPASEDSGEISSSDTLDQALAKLQWQISHMEIGDTLPVSRGGTGRDSFDAGILYSNGASLPLGTMTGSNGNVLIMTNGQPGFRNMSSEDLSDHKAFLHFRELQNTEIDISRFME